RHRVCGTQSWGAKVFGSLASASGPAAPEFIRRPSSSREIRPGSALRPSPPFIHVIHVCQWRRRKAMASADACRFKWRIRPAALLAVGMLVLFGAALGWAPSAEAQATFCSAFISLSPNKGQNLPADVLTPGPPNNVVSIDVFVLQSCFTNGNA